MIAEYSQHLPLSRTSLVVSAVLMIALSAGFTAVDLWYVPAALAVGIAGITLMITNPKFWILFVSATLPLFITSSDKGVSVADVLFGAMYVGTLAAWLFHRVFIDRGQLVRDWLDVIVLLYFVCVSSNVVTAYAYGTAPVDWVRQFGIGILVLYYLPIREYFTTKRDLTQLAVVLATVLLIITAQSLLVYRSTIQASVYAYQLTGERLVPQAYAMGCIASFLLLISQPITKKRMLGILTTFLFMVGLVTTFARTTWLAVLFTLLLAHFSLSVRELKRTLALGFVFVVGAVTGVSIAFGRIAQAVLHVIANRFTSSSHFGSDAAMGNRIYEARGVLRYIEHNPITGYGLLTHYQAYDGYIGNSADKTFVHYGFLSPFYFFGVAGAVLQFLVLGVSLVRAYNVVRKVRRTHFAHVIALICFCVILAMIIENITAAIFFFRTAVFVLAFCFAGISIALKLDEEAQCQQLRQ